MKAIILAAGKGTRLKHLTYELPKGMLKYNDSPIIEHQIKTLRESGIQDIIIVRGFQGEKINFDGIKYYSNPLYSETNMVETLFCAENELQGDVIVSYADILYSKELLKSLMQTKDDVSVAVDMNWKNYWSLRYGKIDFDTESLSLDGNHIIELGKEDPPIENIDGRYIGIIKFSSKGINMLKDCYHKNKKLFTGKPWQQSGRVFEQAYFTDILNQLIVDKQKVAACKVEGGWLEFDTVDDYNFAINILENPEKYKSIYKI